ncbi:Uncharacterized protein Adt_23185 [Abeliophyllum distichum]|uniref:Uncharacterized protein n=1 Tax=Abeliophyllum distichum TaxID=126358 RepID=A0ABD1SA64_9LAMI
MAEAQVRLAAKQEAIRAAAVEVVQLTAQQIQQHDDKEEDDCGNMPMAQFLTPVAGPDRSSIVYPAFGRHDFQLRVDLINLFSNNLQFYRNVHESLNTRLSRFLQMCHNF